MNQLELVYLLVASMLGGVIYGWVSWLNSGEEFDERKFLAGLLNSFFAALVQFVEYAVMVQDEPLTVIILVNAALAGAGMNALLSKAKKSA